MEQEPADNTAVGTITTELIRFMGQYYTSRSKISSYQADSFLVWEAFESDFPIAGWRFVTAQDQGTIYTQVVSAEMLGLGRLVAPLMIRVLQRQMQKELLNLKALLEQAALQTA